MIRALLAISLIATPAVAREASYSERPPERYLMDAEVPKSSVLFARDVVDAGRICRPPNGKRWNGWIFGCAQHRGLVVLPDPCKFKGIAAAAVCAGAPITVRLVCFERNAWAQGACHEIGHWAGWPADHRRD